MISDNNKNRSASVAHGTYNAEGAGIKHDAGKLQWHLLPMKYLRGVVQVLMYGANKYAPHNWRRGMPYTQVYNAMQRHIHAYMDGIDNDADTGLSHLDHAMCCLMFLKAYSVEFPEHDDRFINPRNQIGREELTNA